MKTSILYMDNREVYNVIIDVNDKLYINTRFPIKQLLIEINNTENSHLYIQTIYLIWK